MADALIVGGGLIGLLCARWLHAEGFSVSVLDRDQPGQQASWASAGIVSGQIPGARDPASQLNNLSVSLWPELAEQLRDETGMDVEYRENGHLVPAFTAEEADQMRRSAPLLARAGVPTEYLDGAALREAEPALGPVVLAGQTIPGGNVDNRRATRAAEMALRQAGVRVLAGSLVGEIIERGGRVAGVRTPQGEHRADVVVLAAGSWSGQIPGANPPVPVVPQRGQILALAATERPLRRVIMKPDDPYLVPRVDGRVVVGATREFVGYDRSITAGGVAWLLASAIEMVPSFAGTPIGEIWTGFRPVSVDGLPIVGESDVKGLFYATGHGASGIGPAPGTAALLASLVAGKSPPIDAGPFSPARFRARV